MDGQNFDPSFGKAPSTGPITIKAPEIKVAQPTFNVQDFEDEEVNRAKEEGSVQFASGVVRVSDAPTYNLPEVNKSLYGEKLGITRASELRAAVGLKDNESFTEYYKTNKFVPTGFDIDAKILLKEEKIKGLEQQVAQGKMGYQTFLYKAYGEDLLKADGHDVKSSLYWYNRRKQGMFDSPIDNVTYLTSLLQQAETLYQKELWHSESNTRTIQNSFLGQMGDKNVLPTDKIRDLFEEQFKQLDTMVESDEEKIRLYKAGLLRGFTPTIDEDGDGKVDWYLHRDGNLYRVKQAGTDGPDSKAISYYNEDGSLDRIEIDGMFGVYGDQFVQGFGGAIAGIADLFIYGAVGIADTLENLFTGNWEYDKLADVYKEVEGFKASTYLLGNNVYTTSSGWTNADGTIDGDGIARGVARGVGTLAGMIALSGIGTSLSNFGVSKAQVLDQFGKQAVGKAITKNGILETGIRSIGNAINGVVGLSQGVYRAGSSSAVLTATQATVRGLGFLAVKDFSTTVASLSASKDLIGISDEEIIGKSLTMTGLNFGLSFLLRSVGTTPATTRLASWWKAKFQKTAEIKAAGALDDTFADKLLRWAANENQRKSFIFANSAMDLAENMLTMGTQTSLASTGKLFDKEAWKGLLDPQNIALQGLLFRNNVSGGLRGDDMQMGAAGVAAQLDNLNKVYNGDIINRMLATASEKFASGKDADVQAAETINLAVKEANRIKDDESKKINPAIGIQKAITYLHETFKDDGDMSFVRDAIVKTYNKARTDEIVLGTKAAIETYTSVVAAKLNMQKDALLKGNIFGPGTFISSKLTDSKVRKIKEIAQQFEGSLANLARYSLVNKISSFDLLTKTTTKSLASNKAEFERIATVAGVKLDNIGEVKFESVEVKQPDGTTKTEYKIATPDGEIFVDENLKLIGDFIATVGKGDPNNLKNWAVITMPNAGDDTQAARKQTVDLFNTLADIAKADESPDIISPIYRLGNGTYIVPSFNDGVTIKTLSELHGALANLYGVKYNVKVEDKAIAFRNLFEGFTGKAYSQDQNVEAAQMLNKLITNGFITLDEAAGLLNSTMFSNIKTDASVDLKNLTMLNKALVFAKGVKLLEAYREANSKDPATRDDSVVEKIRKEFMDYYTNELQSEPELQLLLSKRNGFSKQDLLNYVKENPLKDKDRLLSLYQTLSEGLGINEDSQVDDILRKDILNELTELTGIKDIVSRFIPDAVADGLRKISADGKTNLGIVIQKLLEAKSPQDLRSKILSLSEGNFSKAIDNSVSLLVKPDGSVWTPEETPQLKAELLDNLKKNFYNIKANVIKDMLFNGQDELFFKDLISSYDKINTAFPKEQSSFRTNLDRITSNKDGDRDFVYEKILSNENYIKEVFERSPETKHLETALKLYEETYIKDTISRKSSGKIILNVNELLGNFQARFKEALANPYKASNILSAASVEDKLRQVFGEKYVDLAKGNISTEGFVAENLYHMYKDRIVAGNIEFNFSIVNGKVMLADQGDSAILNKTLKDLGYNFFDLQETLDNIPGIYFKFQSEDAAIDLEFDKAESGGLSAKALFLDGLRKKGTLSWDDVSKKAYIANVDFEELLINQTGNLNYIDDNTVITFKDKELPRYYGTLNFEISSRVQSILDASPNINIKQGRNGGALFKAYFLSRVLPGVLSDVDVALKRNVFVLDIIDTIDAYIKQVQKDVSEDKTFILSEIVLSKKQIEDFKNNGDLYDFEFVKNYEDKSNRELGIYIIKPKLDFKSRALAYIETNKKINLNYLLPEEARGSRNALEQFGSENKVFGPGDNVALANNARLLKTSTTGYDLTRFVNDYIRQSYSENFITETYLLEVPFNKLGLNLENNIIDFLKGKTYKEILSLSNSIIPGTNLRLNQTIYYEMLSRFLNGSKKLSDEMLTRLGIDQENKDLNLILSDEEVRKLLGKELQVLLRQTVDTRTEDRSKDNPIKDKDDARIEALKNKVNALLSKNKVSKFAKAATSYQLLMHGTEPNGKTSIDSYSVSQLGLENKIISTVTNEDIFSIYKAATEDNEFQVLSSISLEGRIDPVVSKIKAITSTSDSKDENRLSIYIDDLYRLSNDEFSKVYEYFKNNGVKKSSLDLLQQKYNFINENSTFYNAAFKTNTDQDSYYIEERLMSVAGLPAAVRSDTISISLKDGPYSKKNLERWIENAINKPFISSNINSKAVKTSAVDIDTRNPFYNLMANLKNRIERDAESPLTGSRLVQNLQHYEFLGKLIHNVISLSKNLETVFEKKNIKISREDAVKIALTMFNQTTGVTYDKFYADIFFYDTEAKTIKAVTGSGNTDKALGYVASKYITDYADKKPGTIIAFQVDKDALLSSSVRATGAVKYMVLDNQKTKTLNHLVNNFVFREYDRNPPKDLEADPNTKDVFAHVLARYTNQSDRLDHITSTLVKLKIPQQYARSLAKTLFFNGQNVSVGSNKDSLAAAKAMNTLKLNDPNYRTSNVKENNVQKSLNDALYFINVNDLPSDYTRELRTMAGDFEVSLSKDNNYRQDVAETVRLILSKGVKDQDVLNKMEAFANKAPTLELKKQFLQDVTALYILKKNDGATHNFLLLDNNINQLMIKATSANKLDFVTQNGSKIEASRLLAEDFFVGDIENAWYMDGKNEVPLVLELSLNQYKGIQNIERFFNESEKLELINKNTITIPAFYKGKVLTEEILIKETGGIEAKLSREQRLERLLPEYFNKFYKQFNESSKMVWDNYFKNIEGIIKKYNVKNKEDAGRYLIQRANDFGYDGNKVLLSFNGKSHDFGTNDKDSILNKAGIINKDNTFFQNKHVDIFNDLYTSNRFEVDSYADQQGMALVDIASKLGIKYDNAHTSSSDVDATTQIAIKLLANISNSNRFTSNILNVFEDLRTNIGLNETDITAKEQVSKVPQLKESFLTIDTKEFIKNYKDAFDEKNIKDFNKAFGTIVNSLKDYLDNIEKEVKRKQVRELIRDELGRKLEFYERVQKNSNEFASMLEYLIFKQQRFNSDIEQKLDKNNLLSKKADETGIEFSNKSGFLKLYDLLKDVFGDENESVDEKGNTRTFKSLSALGLEKIFSLDPREFFTAIESYFADNSITSKTSGYQYPGFELSYNDYLANKDLYNGKPLKEVVNELKNDGTLASINESQETYRLSEKFFRNYETLFGSIVEGFDKNIQDIIFNEAATPYLKNLALSEEQFKNRILNKGLKLNDSKFSAELKKLINNSSFGTTFHYNAFFEQANQADYLKRYEFENGIKGFIGANEIGLTAKKYEELTGLSYSDAQSLFKTKDGGSIYLNVMRHPVDKIGSIASLKVKILADTPDNNRITVLVNTDMLYSILAGDVDGDYLTIITPTKGMVKFNQDLNRYIKKGNDLVGQAIQGLSNPKLVNDSLLLKLALTFDRSFSERAIKDRAELIEGKVSFEAKKEKRLAELKNEVAARKQTLTDKEFDDLLEKIWLREFDLSSLIVNVDRKVYLSSNRFLNDDINSKAFKELSFAQTRNFGTQAFADTSYGFFSNLTNRVGEKIKSKDAKFILNYSAFGLTDYTQEFINANLDAFKVILNDKVKIAFENKDLPISNEDFVSLTKLITESKNAIQISSAMNKLDTLIIESEEFGNAYAASYKGFTELDKDILSSRENYNLNLLSEYAKSLGIKLEDAFDLAKLQETLYEKLADYSKGNFWASSGSANKRKEDLIRGIEKLESDYSNKDGNKPKGSILYHQKVAGITDEDGFNADLHSNVVIVMNKDKFKDSMPINDADNYMYVQNSINQIKMIKGFNYSLNSLDVNLANKLLSLRDGNNVVKEDILLSNGNVIPKGFKIGQIVALPNGSYKVLALYETGFQPGTKVVVPGTKAAKATNGGELKGTLADIIKANNLNVDFVYGTSSFDYKNITPLIGKSFKESQLTYYRYNESNKQLEQTSPLKADFAVLKELPMQLTQTFFESKIKRREVDDITLSTSKRNIFGNVLFGDTFITVDKNDPTKISFDSEKISEGAKALNVFNQPTLIGNNAAYLHGLLINSIALKYSGLSKAEQSQSINNFVANYDLASVASIANFWYIIKNSYDNDINKLLSKATDVEKIILSNNLYKNFFDEKNGRILNTSDDLIQKSKNAGFEREIKEVDSTLRSFKPDGEMARHLATQLKNKIFDGKYKNSLVFDTAFGHYSMLEYLNFIVNSINSINEGVPGYKPLARILSKDATDASLLNILNLGNGIGSSLSEGFNTINMRDALIEQSPENYSLNQAHQKTAALQPGTVYSVETKKILPSKFSELKKHNDFEQTESKFTNRFAATGKAFDDNNKKYVSDYKNLRSSVNTNAEGGTPFTNLRHSEVRFLKYLLGTVGQAKDIYERVGLFGFNDKVYAPLSVTGISVNSNDNRISLGYDNEFIESDVTNIKKTIEDKINSRRFLDLFEFKSNNLKDSIQNIIKKDPNNVGLSTRIKEELFEKETDELDGLLKEMPDTDKTSAGQGIWNNMFKEEFPLDNDDIKFRQKIFYEANKEKLTNVFSEDWLRSGLFKISNTDSGLSIEVERAIKDYLIEPVVLQKQFTQPLKDLHDFASSLGVSEKLNHYAAAKYYEYAIQKIEKNLASDTLKDTDRSSLNILLQTYKQDFNELRTGFATPIEFMQSFEKLYEPVIREFNKVNSALGLQFKKYSILTDESSDSLFYLLKPNVRKGLEKEEKLFMRLSMFTYNDEKEYEAVDLASYNYFDDLHTKLIMLSKQAATVNLSHKLKSLGLMANLPVKDFLTKTLLPELESAANSFVVTGKRGRELTDDVYDFFDDIDSALFKNFGLPSISKKVASDILTGKLGNALFKGYLELETELAKRSDGMSRDQVFTLLRSSKPESDEYKKAVGLLNLYELQNNALIMLTNNLDKNILTNLYTSLKAEAERNDTVLSDKFGRILHEDPRDYKLIFSGSTEAVKHLVKYSSYSGGYEKNIILDALNGDVFFANKSLAESLDKNFFTTKMPNKVLQSIAKVNSLMSKLIMSNPFRYLDRLIGFTVYDVATLGSFEPKTFTKLPVAINQISAFLQSKYSVMSPELKEFLTESGIDIKSANFSEIFSGYDQKGLLDKLIDPITEPLGKGFNIQNIVGRFSYWMAVKENLDNNKPINYGPSLKIKDAVDSLQQKVNDDGEVQVSSNGRKAYFLMSEILGAPGDFPILARKLKGLAMFTTFPLAAARFTRGILGSASTALKEMFVGDNKQVALRWLTSTGLGMAGLFAIPWLIFETWGNVMGLSEEEKEEWKETGDGMPEFVRSIFTGSPVVNKFNTFNQYALLESMTTKPFKEAIDEGGTLIDGAGRWILDNVASRGPAPLKLTAEVLGGFDSFGGTIQDNTDQWSMWENFQRKIAAYVIGGSGANALTTYLNKDLKYTDDSFSEIFINGFRTVIEAEMGNTVAFKTDIKNYYRANNLIQSARFANPKDPFYTSSNFDTDNYNDVKNEIGRAMRRKAKPSVVYGIIIDAMKEGVDIREIRSAVRNNSLEYKLSQVPNIGEFYNNLSESEYKTINNAIAYERQIYPFLNDLLIQVNDLYKRNATNSNYTPRVYIPRVYNSNNYRTNYSYNYNTFVRNSKYNNLFRIYDPYKAFRASWFKLNNLDKPQE